MEIVENKTKLTVKDLLDMLNNAIKHDPSIKDAPVFHVEFGGLTQSTMIVSDHGRIVIS